jgi:hypothetical protein
MDLEHDLHILQNIELRVRRDLGALAAARAGSKGDHRQRGAIGMYR